MKGYYVAVITKISENRYECRVPDLQGCVSSGQTFEEAYENIKDATNLWVTDVVLSKEDVPKASDILNIKAADNEIVQLIPVDTDAYMRETQTQAVRRSVSIPYWMDVLAQKKRLSLSKTLQEALETKLA